MDPTRQLLAHVNALRAAGIDFVPIPPANEVLVEVGSTNMPNNSLAITPSLFSGLPAPSISPLDPETRRQSLSLLAEEVKGCPKCPELYSTRTQTVFGAGSPTAELCFIGEAPGADEDRTGEPFVGPAGQLLTKIIIAMGLSRDEVYICNTLKCRPPMNRSPSPDELKNCRPFFERQIELLQPKFICCLGGVAASAVLGTKVGITKLRGTWRDYNGIPVLCTFHPSFLLRDPSQKKYVWDDMKTLLTRMGRPIPGAK